MDALTHEPAELEFSYPPAEHEINPCPLCGLPPHSGYQFSRLFYINCFQCCLEILDGTVSESTVIERWNSLTTTAQVTQELEF